MDPDRPPNIDPDIGSDAGSQPYNYGGSHSQSAISDILLLSDNKVRRNITTGEEYESRFKLLPYGELPRSEYSTLKQLQDAVFSLLVARLKRSHIVSPLLAAISFDWALPKR
jgi:hypothetical protein